MKKISVDILGKSKEASSLPQIRLHVDIENLFIATSKDEQLCMASDDCYNRLSMQLVVLKDEQPMQYFYIVDQCSSQFQFEKGTDQIEIALKANLCGGNFNQANKNYGSGGDEISIGASLIINLDTNGNVSGYSLDARLETVNDELEEINKRTIIELTGSGTIQDTTDNNGRNISSTGSIIANMNNANMDLQMRTAIDTAFSIQIDNGSPISTSTASATLTINLLDANLVQQSQTAIDTTFSIQIDNSSPISTSAASATLTINFLDANLVQQSRMVFNPQLSLNIDRTNPQTAYDTSLALDITNFDSDLVKTNEQNYSASTSGTLAQTKANTQIANGVLTVNLPNEGTDQIEVNDAPYQLTIQNHNGCTEICGNHSEAIKFTLNRQSGFWNKKEATHKIIYVRKSGTALRIGLIEIKRIERINESNIFFNVAPTNQ